MPDEILMGAPGNMFALPVPEIGGYTETPVKFGAIHQGLTGARTLDNLGTRREWSMTWEDLDPSDCSALQGLYDQLRTDAGSVRLIQPYRKNLLTSVAASGGSVPAPRSSVTPFQTSNTSVVATRTLVPRQSVDATYGLSPRLTFYTRVANGATGGQTCWPEGFPNNSAYSRIPVIPGRTYTLSAYVRAVAGTGATMGLGVMREDGNLSSAPTQTPETIIDTVWTWVARSYTIPTGWHIAYPTFTLPASSTIDVAAMQFEEGAGRTTWEHGSGAPIVAVTGLSFTDTWWPYRNATMSVIEL